MSTRNLSVLVLTLVLGTIFMVGWYLEGARTSVDRTPDPQGGQRLEHVWRPYPDASIRPIRSSQRRSSPSNSGTISGRARVSAFNPAVFGTEDHGEASTTFTPLPQR